LEIPQDTPEPAGKVARLKANITIRAISRMTLKKQGAQAKRAVQRLREAWNKSGKPDLSLSILL
jgi:hypothetical protein